METSTEQTATTTTDFFGIVRAVAGSPLLESIGSQYGESIERLRAGVGAAVPVLVAGILHRGTSLEGAEFLLDAIDTDKAGSLPSQSRGVLTSLFGDRLGDVIDFITRKSGLRTGSTRALLEGLVPFTLTALGAKLDERGGRSVTRLMGYLTHQRRSLWAVLPAGLLSVLGVESAASVAERHEHDAGERNRGVADERRRMAAWLPAALVAAVVLGIWLWNKPSGSSRSTQTETASRQAVSSPSLLPSPAVLIPLPLLPPPPPVVMPAPQATKFEGILFSSGSAALLSSSRPVLDDLAEYLRNNPQVRVRLEGHTDATGHFQRNQNLSRERAMTVQRSLVERGIDAGRLEISGRGQTGPVAGNDSQQGRQQNRRIDVVVLASGN
jgi:outer membrane protein OmpA-like peptidoglycan-associated protein